MKVKDACYSKPVRGEEDQPSCHLYFGGIGSAMNTSKDALVALLSKFGELDKSIILYNDMQLEDGIYFPEDRRYCYASFASLASAVAAYEYFQNNPNLTELNASKLVVRYATITSQNKTSPEPECTSLTESIVVPGLHIIEDFISIDEENALLDEFGSDNALWKETLKRRVQHYGFIFNYRTLMVDYARPTPAMPQSCTLLAKHISEYCLTHNTDYNINKDDISNNPINQLTINEYLPGQGIASHTDTEACFGPILYVINIAGSIVMNFTKNHSENHSSEDNSEEKIKKCVYLPQRSLVVLSGESRYSWSHSIAPRKYDKINGMLIPRTKRISFTFRSVIKPGAIPSSQLTSGNIEEEHVVKVYDAIAVHWNHTRGKRKVWWHRVKDFIDNLPLGSLVADIGSGDGKYFGVNPNIVTIGCDRSLKLLEVSQENHHETFACDAVKLPFLSESFDAVICIAVLHHLASVDRRVALISELVRIAKPNARIFIQAWALEQDNNSKRVFESQDTMVPWKLNKRFIPDDTGKAHDRKDEAEGGKMAADQDEIVVYERYCHVYKEGELDDLCSVVAGCEIVETGWDRGNWFVQLNKINDNRLAGQCGEVKVLNLPSIALHSLV